ncbi:hypothetical protein Q3G72_011288 [Acer saccharum]|nr:hypothetical protein Q3G72_011288 [Acer saccharum]
MTLWEGFKPFGKVRDVFIASKKSTRRCSFGFIRFESMEEAIKVVSMVNGMYVHGWPISAKVASIGWSSRRKAVSKKGNEHGVHGLSSARVMDGLDKVFKASDDRNRSFVEVLASNHKCNVGVEDDGVKKVLQMSWNNYNNEDEWLSRCAMGVLKEFNNVLSVNTRLTSRGLSFSSTYLGDKSVLWVFDSEFVRDGFINNRYWNEAFFLKIGWQLGEPLMVDEETLNKKRFDRGRLLALIPPNQVCSSKIKVAVGSDSFCVYASEEPALVDSSWPANVLGLQTVKVTSPELVSQEVDGSSLCVDQEKYDMGRKVCSRQSKSEGKDKVKHKDSQITHNNEWAVRSLKPKSRYAISSIGKIKHMGCVVGVCSNSNKGMGRLSNENKRVLADTDGVEGESSADLIEIGPVKGAMVLGEGPNFFQTNNGELNTGICEVSMMEKSMEDNQDLHFLTSLISKPVEWGGDADVINNSKLRNGKDYGLAAKGHTMKDTLLHKLIEDDYLSTQEWNWIRMLATKDINMPVILNVSCTRGGRIFKANGDCSMHLSM